MMEGTMDWKQNGAVHRCGDYTIVEFDKNEERWCTLEYGDRYVAEGSYATLSDAKHAALEHADKGSPLSELRSKDHSSSDTPSRKGDYYECFTCRTVLPLIDGIPRDKCSTCDTTNGQVISKERYDEGYRHGVYFNIHGKKKPR
jgi:LSD1 subclass zinc finger protein